MKQFILGLLFVFLFVIPTTAQEQTTLLTTGESDELISKARRSTLTINEYRNIGYYLLRENSPKSANRYFTMASKESSRLRNKYNFLSNSKIKKETDRLQREADSLMSLVYVSNTNTTINTEIELYKAIVQKSYHKMIKLIEEAKPIDRILFGHLAREGKKYTILKEFIPKHLDLMKPKTEFETKAQYRARKDQYKKLEQEATKEIDDKIKSIEIPYKQALKNCANHKGSIETREKTNGFIKKYPPVLKKYADSRIKSITYNAEKQEFTLSVDFKKENDLYRYKTKTYTISVPQSEAQQFKESQLNNQYFFFLQDLRAVISNGKTYTINPINRWYMRLNCDKEIEEAVLLVNNTPDTRGIKTYLEKIIINKPSFLKEAKQLQESYLNDYTKGVLAEISIVFDKKGSYKHTVIEYKRGNRLATENLNRDGSDKQGGAKRSLFSSVNEVMEKENIKIQPPTKQCEPQSAVFTFNYMLSKSMN